jgi:type IV pilus assembly protein PilB
VARARIGELLVEGKVISQTQLDEALAAPRADGVKMGQHLVEQGIVTEAQLTQTLSLQLSVPWVSLYHIDFSRQLLNLVPREVAERFCAVPIFLRTEKKKPSTLYVAMDDPTNEQALAEIGAAAGVPVKPMIASPSDIRSAIRVYYADTNEAPPPPSTMAREPTPPPSTMAREPTPPAPLAPPPPPASASASSSASFAGAPPPVPPRPPPPPPGTGRSPLETVMDAAEILETEPIPATVAEPKPPASQPKPPPSQTKPATLARPGAADSPDADPELEVSEYVPRPRQASGPRMVALTLLDGTTLNLPARQSTPPSRPGSTPPTGSAAGGLSEQLTARDLVSALRAVAHGADATEILGETDWQALFAALLSLMLKKNLIADWEFVEELRNI